MKIALGADSHQHIADVVTDYLKEKGIEPIPCAALAGNQADYVDAAREVGEKVSKGECEQGILFCNTGTGVSIIANKIYGVRAALCVDTFSAEIARLANNANILILSMRLTGDMLARQILDVWFATQPSTEPRRVNFHRKTDELDKLFRRIPE